MEKWSRDAIEEKFRAYTDTSHPMYDSLGKPVANRVRYWAHKFHRGLEARYDLDDLLSYGWEIVWHSCGKSLQNGVDPLEAPGKFYCYLDFRLRDGFRDNFLKYSTRATRNIREEVTSDFDVDLLPSRFPSGEEILYVQGAVSLLQEAVVDADDPALVVVFLCLLFPSTNFDRVLKEYIKKRKIKKLNIIPNSVYAGSVGMDPQTFRRKRRKLQKLAIKVGLSPNRQVREEATA